METQNTDLSADAAERIMAADFKNIVKKVREGIEDRELRLASRKGEYVSLEEVRLTWTTQVGRAIALMRAKFESELPPILSGLDAYAIQRELSAAIDEVCTTLRNGGKCTP